VKSRPEDPIDFNPMYGRKPKLFGMDAEIFFLFVFSWIAGLVIFAILSYAGLPFALFPTISLGGQTIYRSYSISLCTNLCSPFSR
jgi:hypothetical protein